MLFQPYLEPVLDLFWQVLQMRRWNKSMEHCGACLFCKPPEFSMSVHPSLNQEL